MSGATLEQLLRHHARLMALATQARSRGEAEFADLLVDRAAKYTIQISELEAGQASGESAEPA